MDNAAFVPSLLVMAGVTYLIRMLPMAVIRRRVQGALLQAFLRYMPYAVLGAMTFPAVFTCTGNTAASVLGLAAGLALAYMEKSLLTVALTACAVAFAAGFVL